MTDYPARSSYRDAETARAYDAQRFRDFRGRLGAWLDERAIAAALQWAGGRFGPIRRVVDLPCGTGRISRFLHRRGLRSVGVDVSLEMIGVARAVAAAEGLRGDCLQCDGTAVGLRRDAADCVVCVRFMGHIPRETRTAILAEFGRLARLVLVEFSMPTMTTRFVKRLRRGRLFSRLPRRWAWAEFTAGEVQEEGAVAGLQVLRGWSKLRFLSDSRFVLFQRAGADAHSRGE